MNKSFTTILLAAGLSSRMGKLKALLDWQGKPLITYQIKQMKAANINDIHVVLGYKADKIKKYIYQEDVNAIINERYEEGKSSSIRAGAASVDEHTDGIFVTAVDQPVPAQTLKLLMNELIQKNKPIIIPTYEGKKGHPILFAGHMKKELLNVQEETMGMREIIVNYNDEIEYVAVDDPAILINFNRPEDYERYRMQGGLS